MTEPLTDAELDAFSHISTQWADVPKTCYICDEKWPCTTEKVVIELRALREQNAALHKYVTELIDKNVALVTALESSLGFLREVHRVVSGDRFTDRHDWTGISATLIKQSCDALARVRGAE